MRILLQPPNATLAAIRCGVVIGMGCATLLGCQTLHFQSATCLRRSACGGYDWRIVLHLQDPSPRGGWIIQQIDEARSIKNGDATVQEASTVATYWEAWRIEPGARSDDSEVKRAFGFDDPWDEDDHPETCGAIRIVGEARFFEDVTLPADFKPYNRQTLAGNILRLLAFVTLEKLVVVAIDDEGLKLLDGLAHDLQVACHGRRHALGEGLARHGQDLFQHLDVPLDVVVRHVAPRSSRSIVTPSSSEHRGDYLSLGGF